jgi:hypothetical protein
MLNKVKNEINIYLNLYKEYKELYEYEPNIIKDINPYKYDDYLSYTNNLKKFNYYYHNSNNISLKKLNIISKQSIDLMSFIVHINIKNILVISHNLYLIYPILYNKLNNNKIIFIVINTINIDQLIYLKQTYSDKIDIYYIGYDYNYDTYLTILDILKNKTFTSIIIDIGKNYLEDSYYEKGTIIGLLLLDKYLSNDGCYIDYNYLYINIDNPFIYILNIIYNSFYNHNLHDLYLNWNIRNDNKSTLYIYNNIKSRLSSNIKNKLINFLKYNDKEIFTDYKLSNDFLENLYIRWYKIRLIAQENFLRLKNSIIKKTKRLNYHRNKINKTILLKNKILPQTINDLPYIENININEIYEPNINYKEKSLLLLYINVLTKIKNIENIIFYTNKSKYLFLPILFNLFPNIIWYINNINCCEQHNNIIYFKNIKEININNKIILFISDYYDDNKSIVKNMTEQANIGINLNANYLLLNFYLLNDNDYPKNISELGFKNIKNNDLFTTFNFLFLKGELLLNLYSSENKCNLLIKKKDNMYELEVYDMILIQNKLFNYNKYIKSNFGCTEEYEICKSLPLDYINCLPGFDTSIECLIEYKIIYDFYYNYFNITDPKVIINKIYDINILLEKLTNKLFIMSSYNSIINELEVTPKENFEKYIRLYYWKNIILFNIKLSAKYQKEYILKHGPEIFSQERIDKAIEYLEQFITDKKYYKFKTEIPF